MSSNPFGGFVHTSPLAPLPHDPCITLASNCVRDHFGPTVQTVADCLQSRGGTSTLPQLVSSIRSKCCSEWNEERERLVSRLVEKNKQDSLQSHDQYRVHRARGPENAGYVVETESIRAALLVLFQHSLVKVQVSKNNVESVGSKRKKCNALTFHYSFDIHRARLLPRYSRYIQYTRKSVDENGAALVEELLVNGRLETQNAVAGTAGAIWLQAKTDPTETEKEATLKGIVESFVRLTAEGFIEETTRIGVEDETDEFELEGGSSTFQPPPEKKRKVEKNRKTGSGGQKSSTEQKVLSILQSAPYRQQLRLGAVWRVNFARYHDSLRAFCLGKFASELYRPEVPRCGSMVTAALQYVANCRHGRKEGQGDGENTEGTFSPQDIIPQLPVPVREALESGEDDGGRKLQSIVRHLSDALLELSNFTSPMVIVEVEVAEGHPQGGKFQIAVDSLLSHLKDRLFHQMILDSHGEVAARICSYLQASGHQESDAIAEAAMVPAKDVREVLHRLYRSNYIKLMSLQQSKQHNPANAIYLWSVDRSRILGTVSKNVTTALFHIRLRRQHEMEVGKDWIERAKESRTGTTDENDHELDKVNHNKFCRGLERLDHAALQLDETLMLLKDF